MDKSVSAPLLSQVKSWQLVGLGISGWCTLYSVAILTWGTSSALIGNAQGGCFAATMTLAGLEAKRYRKSALPTDPLQWTVGISTEYVNQAIATLLLTRQFHIESCRNNENEMGIAVRGVNSGRTVVFETGRWREPIIDLDHVQATEENRRKAGADLAVIVSAGNPDENAKNFVRTVPVEFLAGNQLKELLAAEKPGRKQKA
jgi:hypothetical protein